MREIVKKGKAYLLCNCGKYIPKSLVTSGKWVYCPHCGIEIGKGESIHDKDEKR